MFSVHLELRHLVRALRAVAHIAGDHTGHDKLDNIRIEAADGTFAAVAVNRYAMAYARVPARGILPPAYISRDNIMTMIRTYEPCEHLRTVDNDPTDTYDGAGPTGESVMTVGVDGDGDYVRIFIDSLGDLSPATVVSTVHVHNPPDYRTLFSGATDTANHPDRPGPGQPGDTLGVQMRWISEIYQAVGNPTPGGTWRITPGHRRRTIRIEYADWFIAAIMPAIANRRMGEWRPVEFALPYTDRVS